MLHSDADDPGLLTNFEARMQIATAAELLDPADLAVLDDLIRLNRLDEGTSRFDRHDGDGILQAWELGFQVWRDGRLVALSLGPDPHSSFGYELQSLPSSIEDLSALEYLGLQSNRLTGFPEQLGQLGRLRELVAYDNLLAALPASIGQLGSLERLVLTDNQLRSLPFEVGGLRFLEELHLANNPIDTLPESLMKLRTLRILDLSRHASEADGFTTLPPGLESLEGLEELYLAGRRLPCTPGGLQAADPLDTRGASIFGLGSSGCAP